MCERESSRLRVFVRYNVCVSGRYVHSPLFNTLGCSNHVQIEEETFSLRKHRSYTAYSDSSVRPDISPPNANADSAIHDVIDFK